MYNVCVCVCVCICFLNLFLWFSGGLVHRSNAASSSGGGATGGGAEASGWGPPGAEKNPDLPDQEDDGYDDKNEDSKSMRLTLMEEVLLLGIKDREVGGITCTYIQCLDMLSQHSVHITFVLEDIA